MNPGVGPLGKAFGAYALLSMLTIPVALGIGLDERAASALSIGVGVTVASLLLVRRYLPIAYGVVTDLHQ